MRGFVTAVVCLFLATTAVRCSPAGSCVSQGGAYQTQYLADDRNCSVFYECGRVEQKKLSCPAGLHFSRSLQVCDWPASAGCLSFSILDEPRPHAAPEVPARTVVFTTAAPTPKPVVPLSPEEVGCPAVGSCPQHEDASSVAVQLPHAHDCSRFCKCDHGKPVTFSCPAGLQFNAELQVCDWPASAGCLIDGGFNAPSSPTPAPAEDDDSAVPAKPIAPVVRLCDPVGTCPTGIQNSVQTLLPHRKNCRLYCKCYNGVALTQKCPFNLHFNADRGVCDLPLFSGCLF